MATFIASVFKSILIILICIPIIWTKCTINVNEHYGIDSPLFLNKKSLGIVYPEKSSSELLSFKVGQEHMIHCFGGHIKRYDQNTSSISEVSECVKGLTFSNPYLEIEYTFGRINCTETPSPVTKEDHNKKCKNGIVVDIGYQLSQPVFWKNIDLCYVSELATTTWAHSKILGIIQSKASSGFQLPSFSKGPYFKNVSMSNVYPVSSQRQMFMEIFDNDTDIVDRYLPQTGPSKNYFAKGHLVARADAFYLPEQYSTYFYVNVLPMWSSINNGNWKSVESTVRRIANVVGDLEVWTGGLGQLKLSLKSIFLGKHRADESKKLVPVPKLLFKLVYSTSSNSALVFITANNPYLDEKKVPKDYRICKKYKKCTEWFPKFEQRFKGYTYCCLYKDFISSKEAKKIGLPVTLENVKTLQLY